MDKINLNFLSLEQQDFNFKVFRKLYDGHLPKSESVFVYRLKKGDENEEYASYYLSFDYKEGFEEYQCQSIENKELTKKFYFLCLIRRLEKNKNIQYSVVDKKFIKEINFIIQRTSKGVQQIQLSPYFLEIEKQFGFLIDFKFELNEGLYQDKEALIQSLSLDRHGKSNKNFYNDKYSYVSSFIQKRIPEIFPLEELGVKIEIKLNLSIVHSNRLEKKTYLFKDGKVGFSQFQGIRSYGPYKETNDNISYVFLFQDKFKSFANDIFLSLTGKINPGTFPGMETMFKLPINKSNVIRVPLNNATIDEIERVLPDIFKIRNDDPTRKVIVVFLEESDVDLSVLKTESVYYYLKYALLKEQIPLQVISYENVGDPNSLKWSTSNIGLQLFSKLGGIPWIVKPTNNNCLILGIGSAHKKNKADGEIVKYLAYSVCLDSSGVYKKLSILSESDTKTNYLSSLKENLINLLKDPSLVHYKKCVLHIPFKIKKDEIDSIKAAISLINGIEFKVIKINTNNKFFGYSEHNTRVPYESTFVKLSRNEYLIWFEGLNPGKEIVYQRVANPVHIQFLNFDATTKEQDWGYLQDVLNLSGANWRGFNAKSVPISIYYSKIIAEYTKAFEDFSDFDKSIFSANNPWFL